MTLSLLIIVAGTVFIWYRIKTRGVAIFLDESRQFIARQNAKDVMALKATKRFFLILWDKFDEQTQRQHNRHEEKKRERAAYRAAHPKPTPPPERTPPPRARKTASSSNWLNSPWVWLLAAYWLGQHNQKMQQQQKNEPNFWKYPYTPDGRHWNPYTKRYERR